MFEGFANLWTPVAYADELGDKPLGVRVAGEPVALFRPGPGQVAAVIDRCPHRSARLSLGTVDADGCLQCPFHGWAFAADGTCARVPLGDPGPERRATFGVRSLPVREIAGLLWLFTGEHAVGEPDVPEMLLQPGVQARRVSRVFATHWTRVMENMLDSPHVPFVHRKTIGGSMRRAIEAGGTGEVDVEDRPYGFRQRAVTNGQAQSWLDWHRPNGMVLDIPIPGIPTRQHVWCVPIDAEHTKLMLVSARELSWWNPIRFAFGFTEDRILLEDQAVVESHDPKEVPQPGVEKSVATDKATLRFRAWYLARASAARKAGAAR